MPCSTQRRTAASSSSRATRRDESGRKPAGRPGVENYNKSTDKEPGGKCHRTCYARVREASGQVSKTKLPDINWDDKENLGYFAIIWSSHIGDGKKWRKLPEKFRGKGAAGAMAMKGLGTLVEGPEIWAGKLKPGAVIQAWKKAKDHDNVRDGNPQGASGHSFMLSPLRQDGFGDHRHGHRRSGLSKRRPAQETDYGYWVGANIK